MEVKVYALFRVAVALLVAIAFVVFVTRAQEALANGPLFSFVADWQIVTKVFGVVVAVGVWTLLGKK